MRSIPLIAICIVFAACSRSAHRSGMVVARDSTGDTLIVRTISGSLWGDSVRLVQEWRMGALEGPPEYGFGFITDLALEPDGSITLFDQGVPALRLYDSTGHFIRTIGRPGAGPGEYRSHIALAVMPDGSIAEWDGGNARINRFREDGTLLPAISTPDVSYTSLALAADTGGCLYIKFLRNNPHSDTEEWKYGYLRLGASGTISDTLLPPPLPVPFQPHRTPFDPQNIWLVSPLGYQVGAGSDRYAITLFRPKAPLRIERQAERVAFGTDERAQIQAVYDYVRKRSPGEAPAMTLPALKPFIRSILPTGDGRLWVRLFSFAVNDPTQGRVDPRDPGRPPITWREPSVYDAFREDGTYLGQVRLPVGALIMASRGDRIWVIERGTSDEQYVVSYRIDHRPAP